jgi:protein-disulfide isomerase
MQKFIPALVIAIAVALGAAFFLRAPAEPPRPPRVVLTPLPEDQRAALKTWWDLQPQVALPFKTPQAKVVLVKFSDYQCPACRATYFGYESVLDKYKDRPEDVQFVLKQFPLDGACNPSVHARVHALTCEAAAAAVMAGWHGAFDAMNDWLFLHQDAVTSSSIRGAAKRVGHVDDFDGGYAKAIEQIKADAAPGDSLKIEQTPTFFLNGRKIAPAVTPQVMDTLIQFELARHP